MPAYVARSSVSFARSVSRTGSPPERRPSALAALRPACSHTTTVECGMLALSSRSRSAAVSAPLRWSASRPCGELSGAYRRESDAYRSTLKSRTWRAVVSSSALARAVQRAAGSPPSRSAWLAATSSTSFSRPCTLRVATYTRRQSE